MESCFYLLIFWIKNEMKALTAFPWDPDPREPSKGSQQAWSPVGQRAGAACQGSVLQVGVQLIQDFIFLVQHKSGSLRTWLLPQSWCCSRTLTADTS